jgi:hypothetical protein
MAFSRKFALVAVLAALPLGARGASGWPPSPYGEDKHGVYDEASGCWVWDHQSTGKIIGAGYQFITESRCDGKPLEGRATIHWRGDRRAGETWEGTFSNGKFTGQGTAHLLFEDVEETFVDGMRNGPGHVVAPGGAHGEANFKDDLLDGPYLWTYGDGTREQGIFQEGKRTGVWITTFRDGSRMEQPVDEKEPWPGTFFTAGGEQLRGTYVPPRVDRSRRPAVVVKPEMIGKEKRVTLRIVVMVTEDGRAHDPQLAQGSGYPLLDEAMMKQIVLWPFFPATLDGKPMASMAIYHDSFQMR